MGRKWLALSQLEQLKPWKRREGRMDGRVVWGWKGVAGIDIEGVGLVEERRLGARGNIDGSRGEVNGVFATTSSGWHPCWPVTYSPCLRTSLLPLLLFTISHFMPLSRALPYSWAHTHTMQTQQHDPCFFSPLVTISFQVCNVFLLPSLSFWEL